ncbi:hypothetical protein CJF32_00001321 [Rutstroemia sp. NJR-2017a WRK4]|nr:hypothetical protein CJF32_00001321 [Rutstroemia sp. NJR-2017a WRK4]
MAGPPSISTIPNTPVHVRYSNVDGAPQNNTRLPEGQCNFTNLNHGTRCGCRRFWNQSQGGMSAAIYGDGGFSDRSQVCMCEHHACYHDDLPPGSTGVQQTRALSNVSAINVDAIGRMAQVNRQPSTSPTVKVPAADEQDMGHQRNDAKLQSTLHWSRLVHSGSSLDDIPSIPSECVLPSESASRASSQARYRQPFGGLGLGTLDHVPRASKGQQIEAARPMRAYQDINGQTHLQSVTEVLSPSLRPTQDPGLPNDFTDQAQMGGHLAETNIKTVDTGVQVQLIDVDVAQASRLTPGNNGQKLGLMNLDDGDDQLIPKLRNFAADFPITKRNHADRIDALENASFSNTGYEELQECQDMLGNRIDELEERVEEIEKANAGADDNTVCGHRHLNQSMDSQASHASTVTPSNLAARIESLEVQIFEMQAAIPPSYARPLEMEVVFLPFGKQMKGIWSTSHSSSQRSRVNSCASDDWTQTQHSAMTAAFSRQDHSVSWEESASQAGDNDASWLLPKACGAQSRIDQRLRSRGLVKTIQIRGPDARDLQFALMAAFGDLPGILAEDPYAEHRHSKLKVPPALTNYMGLRSTWIPLRKMHKDSCLKFLNTSEMITQALWTVPFISSSVAMRAKQLRRLYVTQADSYIQHLGGTGAANWTWQKLRQLPRVYEDGVVNHTPEGDAKEVCWAWDERLDPPLSPQTSFASQHSQSLSIRIVQDALDPDPESPSDHFSSAAVTPDGSTPPTSVAPPKSAPLFPIKDKNPFRPPRTSSMSALASVVTTQIGKRRTTSFEREPQSSPVRNRKVANMKRRRISQSPSRPRDSQSRPRDSQSRPRDSPSRPRDSPRCSIGPDAPPSPMTSLIQEMTELKRGTTPFAYATPFSNAPYVEQASRSGTNQQETREDDSGSTTDEFPMDFTGQNELSDSEHGESGGDQQEEEWEGVVEEDAPGCEMEQTSAEQNVTEMDDAEKENADAVDEGEESDASSAPSEHPSTQPPNSYWKGDTFFVHEDEDFEDELGR